MRKKKKKTPFSAISKDQESCLARVGRAIYARKTRARSKDVSVSRLEALYSVMGILQVSNQVHVSSRIGFGV